MPTGPRQTESGVPEAVANTRLLRSAMRPAEWWWLPTKSLLTTIRVLLALVVRIGTKRHYGYGEWLRSPESADLDSKCPPWCGVFRWNSRETLVVTGSVKQTTTPPHASPAKTTSEHIRTRRECGCHPELHEAPTRNFSSKLTVKLLTRYLPSQQTRIQINCKFEIKNSCAIEMLTGQTSIEECPRQPEKKKASTENHVRQPRCERKVFFADRRLLTIPSSTYICNEFGQVY
jgi:hypothetical protein